MADDFKGNAWIRAALSGSPLNSSTVPATSSTSLGDFYGEEIARPKETTPTKLQAVRDRFSKRLDKVNSILPIRAGRTIPNEDDMLLGDAKRLQVAVLFLDICGFSTMASRTEEEQERVFAVINVFMSEMLYVIRNLGGYFEKNTGDGLMAYFQGGSERDLAEKAVEAAVTMHCYNDQVLSVMMAAKNMETVKFRVGIEIGSVIVAKVGVRGGEHHSLVAIGNAANIACKLMKLIPKGGIVLGSFTRFHLNSAWQAQTRKTPTPLPGFVYEGTNTPYDGYELIYRVPIQTDWRTALSGLSAS